MVAFRCAYPLQLSQHPLRVTVTAIISRDEHGIIATMSRSLVAVVSLALLAATDAFVTPVATQRGGKLAAKRKGFGDDKFSKPKQKTAAKVEKERAASAYDAAKASGVPEYRVYVTPTGTEQWTPIGCVTVPRTESVSQSIFGNEASLLEVARQAGVKGDLDYGYNRAIFPDDPVTPADRAEALRSTNPLQRFAKDLTNPLGFGGK